MIPVDITNIDIIGCKFTSGNVSFGILEVLKGSNVKINEFMADKDS